MRSGLFAALPIASSRRTRGCDRTYCENPPAPRDRWRATGRAPRLPAGLHRPRTAYGNSGSSRGCPATTRWANPGGTIAASTAPMKQARLTRGRIPARSHWKIARTPDGSLPCNRVVTARVRDVSSPVRNTHVGPPRRARNSSNRRAGVLRRGGPSIPRSWAHSIGHRPFSHGTAAGRVFQVLIQHGHDRLPSRGALFEVIQHPALPASARTAAFDACPDDRRHTFPFFHLDPQLRQSPLRDRQHLQSQVAHRSLPRATDTAWKAITGRRPGPIAPHGRNCGAHTRMENSG